MAKVAKVANVEKVKKDGKVEKVGPRGEILKILVGNWVAQWDPTYKTWFYYNINTGLPSSQVLRDVLWIFFVDFSTWEKPRELQHVRLNTPSG